MQERKVREERTPQDFYTSSLKPKLHPVCQGNLSLTLHYFKRFTKYHQCRKGFWQRLFFMFCTGSELKHIGARPKGEGFWPRVWPEAIDPRLCFGYPRNRGHRVSKFLEIHRSEPHHRSPQMNLTTISPRTPPQQTSPPFETLIVRDHYAASIFNGKAIQIAPNKRMRVICHQYETPKHEWGAGTNQSSSTAAPSNLHQSNHIRPLRQQPLNCVRPHSSPPRTRTCWNEPTTSQQSGTEQWQPSSKNSGGCGGRWRNGAMECGRVRAERDNSFEFGMKINSVGFSNLEP